MKKKFCKYLASLADRCGTHAKGGGVIESRLKIIPFKVVHNRLEDGTGSIIYVTFLGIEIFGLDNQDE